MKIPEDVRHGQGVIRKTQATLKKIAQMELKYVLLAKSPHFLKILWHQ